MALHPHSFIKRCVSVNNAVWEIWPVDTLPKNSVLRPQASLFMVIILIYNNYMSLFLHVNDWFQNAAPLRWKCSGKLADSRSSCSSYRPIHYAFHHSPAKMITPWVADCEELLSFGRRLCSLASESCLDFRFHTGDTAVWIFLKSHSVYLERSSPLSVCK